MNFKRFLSSYNFLNEEQKLNWTKSTRIFAIVRGNEAVRAYVSRMIEKGLGSPAKDVMFLSEVYESLWQFLSYSFKPMKVLFWEKGLLNKEDAVNFIEAVSLLKNRRNIFFDSSDELHDLIREKYKGKLRVRFIDCRLPMDSGTKEEMYKHWFVDVEKIDISPKMIEYLAGIPYLESFNTMEAFKVAGEEDFNLLSVKKWGFVWSDKEQYLVDKLMYKGRVAALREDLRDLNSSRFLWLLFKEVDALLKIKTMFGHYPTEKAAKAGLSLGKFYALKDKAEKISLNDLYKRLYLVVSLLKWRSYTGVVNLLFLYW